MVCRDVLGIFYLDNWCCYASWLEALLLFYTLRLVETLVWPPVFEEARLSIFFVEVVPVY